MIKVFIPVYNEGEKGAKNIDAIWYRLNSLRMDLIMGDFKIFVIDDGSTDNIKEEILKLKNVEYVKYTGPSRRENLALAMIEYSKPGDRGIMLDSDRSVNENVIPYAVGVLMDGYDIVIGSRYIKEAICKRSIGRLIISKVFNQSMRVMFGSKIRDHQCGLKAFRYEVLSELVKDMGYNLQRKFFWDTEMLIRAQRKGYKIKEIPVVWNEGKKSCQSVWNERSMIPYIIKFWMGR